VATETTIKVRVRTFARVRELLGNDFQVDLVEGATVADLWEQLRLRDREMDAIARAIRIAVNGRIVPLLDARLRDGDEVSLLPPVGGG